MSNVEQARQEIYDIISSSGISIGDLSELRYICGEQLSKLIVSPNVEEET